MLEAPGQLVTERLAQRQESMRSDWNAVQDTEALRIALRSYRDFRLLLARQAELMEP